MIVKKCWFHRSVGNRSWPREGWFLFGVVPLYVRDLEPRGVLEVGRPIPEEFRA